MLGLLEYILYKEYVNWERDLVFCIVRKIWILESKSGMLLFESF